ncbi:MAG: PAS domain S-box protein [Gemmatimonadota bacterium]
MLITTEWPPDTGDVLRERYRELCEFLPWGCVVLDGSARMLEVNRAAAILLGASEDDLLGMPLPAYVAAGSVDALLDLLTRARHHTASGDGRTEIVLRHRQSRHVALHARWFGGESMPRCRVAMLDVTAMHVAHVKLRRVADEMRDLYQNAPCGYHAVDSRGLLVGINDTELRWLGYRRREVVGKLHFTDLMPGHCREEFNRVLATLQGQGHVHDVQIDLRRKDGTSFPVLLSATAVIDDAGRLVQSRVSVFDITRRKLAQEEAGRYALRLKAMSLRAAEAQETEKRRLARELHDRVGQNLSALSINLDIMMRQLNAGSHSSIAGRLEDSRRLVDATVESIRNVMAELRPAVLDDYGLAAALRWYAEEFGRRTGVATNVSGTDPNPRLPPNVEGALYRIVQESLTNVAKHAGARQATVVLETNDGTFSLAVSDDGCGFDPASPMQSPNHHGWGLMIMRERAESVGGRLHVESAPRQGTRIVVEVKV